MLVLQGWIICEVPNRLWLVPPGSAMWVPQDVSHSVRVSPNADVCFLFTDPSLTALPSECCTLLISPFVREAILVVAGWVRPYSTNERSLRLIGALLDELSDSPILGLSLPTSENPRLRLIAEQLMSTPDGEHSLEVCARRAGMSTRSLSRLIIKETGMTFGMWRRQAQLILALRLLARGQLVQRVSESLGYESVSAFITMFKKAMGETPARYQALLRSGNARASLR